MSNRHLNSVCDQKFLFLIDFSEESYLALDYLIKFVKTVKGEIEIFHISDNNAKNLNQNVLDTKTIGTKIKAIIEMIEVENVIASASHAIGSYESVLKEKLSQHNYVAVIGKNQNGIINNSSSYLVNKYKGNLMIVGPDDNFLKGSSITIGGDESTLKKCDLKLPSLFSTNTQTPIIVLQPNLKTDENITTSLDFPGDKTPEIYYKSINYKRMLDGFKEFINNNNVELLCICRNESNDSLITRLLKSRKSTKDIINSITTPLLILGEHLKINTYER